jgi:hypothetical protein
MSFLVHLANVAYLSSYCVKNLRLLRLITIVGIALMVPYYLLLPSPLWAPAGWNMVFLGINLYRIKQTGERQ